MRPPTKDEHDAIVAAKGRPVTDSGMKRRKIDTPPDVAHLSIVDRVVADARRTTQAAS